MALAGWMARLRRWPLAPPWRAPLLLLAGIAACLVVPTWQNAERSHDLVVLAFGGGTNFYIGNNPSADGSYAPLRPDRSDVRMEEADAVELATRARGVPLAPSQVSRWWWGRGLGWWRASPRRALELTARKWMLLWGPWEIADVLSTPLAARWIVLLRNPLAGPALFLPAALAGLWMTRRRRQLWPLHGFVLGAQLAIVPFFLFERFRLHLVAIGLPFAGAAARFGLDLFRARAWRRLLVGAAATAAAGCILALVRVPREESVLRINIGTMFFEQGRYAEALREFEAVRSSAPDAWRVDIQIANTLAAMDRLDGALEALQRVLPRLYDEGRRTGLPSRAEIVYCEELAGDLQMARGGASEAAAHYEAALRLAEAAAQPELRRKLALARGGAPAR